MEVNYLYCSIFSTVLSCLGLQWQVSSYFDSVKSDGKDWVGIVLQSNFTLILLANFGINLYFLLLICLKNVFFESLHASESRKMAERTVNYLLYKGAPLALVVPSNVSQFFIWPSWLVIISSLKIFESMARDRLERLNASPSVTPLKYLRVYSALVSVLFADLLWMKLCLVIYKSNNYSSLFLLLFFEPLSIAFETLQAIMVYGFQLFEIWRQHLMDKGDDWFILSFLRGFGCKKSNQLITDWLDKGSVSELRGILVRNLGFVLDMGSLLTSLSHYLTICWLRGISFHFADVFLLMNLRGLLSAIFTRIKTFITLKKALNSLDRSLSDASYEEICAFNDECAICRGAMRRAKKLPCNHLFHLACLRSWLDQGFTERYSCPTCRRPLFLPSQAESAQIPTGQHTSSPVQPFSPVQTLPRSSPVQTLPRSSPVWRGAGLEPGWIPPWQSSNSQSDAASSSSSPLGLQLMMRQLTSAAEPNFPHNPASSSSSAGVRNDRNAPHVGLRFRSGNSGGNRRSAAELLGMVSRVREVLPHLPEELIIQDLLRTNNINITVNNLLVQ